MISAVIRYWSPVFLVFVCLGSSIVEFVALALAMNRDFSWGVPCNRPSSPWFFSVSVSNAGKSCENPDPLPFPLSLSVATKGSFSISFSSLFLLSLLRGCSFTRCAPSWCISAIWSAVVWGIIGFYLPPYEIDFWMACGKDVGQGTTWRWSVRRGIMSADLMWIRCYLLKVYETWFILGFDGALVCASTR